MSETRDSFYKVPTEFQVRYRKISGDELGIFSSFAMRPSPYSTLKSEIENQIFSLSIREESKALFEKAFQILLNIDQRLERLEEQVTAALSGSRQVFETYEWVHGEVGAGGLSFASENRKEGAPGDQYLLDFILPSLPEYRIVAAGELLQKDAAGRSDFRFLSIHDDDREFIHRYVVARERELLRLRASARQSQSGGEEPVSST